MNSTATLLPAAYTAKPAPVLLTVPEMGQMIGLFERLWEMGDHFEVTTIHPDGSRHTYHVLIDDTDDRLDKCAFWCLWNDGRFQRDRFVPAAFLSQVPQPKGAR